MKGLVLFMIYLCCCFRTFGNSSNERRESTNVGQTMKSFTLSRYISLWSKALFFHKLLSLVRVFSLWLIVYPNPESYDP